MLPVNPRLLVFVGFVLTAEFVRAEDAPKVTEKDMSKPPVVMEAFKVDGNYIPKLSFGLSLDVWKNNDTQKVIAIYVRDVRSGSPAQHQGVVQRARIYRIDGKPVEEMVASFFKGTELNDKFVHRLGGARIVLEISIPGEAETRVVTLEEPISRNIPGLLDRFGN